MSRDFGFGRGGMVGKRTRDVHVSIAVPIGVGALPVLAVGGLLELLRMRLVEVSTVIAGLGWVALAVALARARIVSRHDVSRSTA